MKAFRPEPGAAAVPARPATTAGRPDIAVIIPHLNDPRRLGQCLAALAAQSLDMSRAEIVVVDNGSRVSPRDIVAQFPGVRLLEETTPGPGPARNLGVAATRAPVLAFLDSDCLPAPGWAAAIVDRFARDPCPGILGGAVEVTVASPGRPTPAETFDLLYGFRQQRQIARHRFAATANLAVRRAVFDAVGPFGDIGISEDLDWGQRADGLGHHTVFAPEAVVRHPARRDMEALRRQWDRHVAHHYRRARARPLGRLVWLASVPLVALSPLAGIPAIARSPKLSGAAQRWRTFRTLTGVRLFRAGRMLSALLRDGGKSAGRRWNRP